MNFLYTGSYQISILFMAKERIDCLIYNMEYLLVITYWLRYCRIILATAHNVGSLTCERRATS